MYVILHDNNFSQIEIHTLQITKKPPQHWGLTKEVKPTAEGDHFVVPGHSGAVFESDFQSCSFYTLSMSKKNFFLNFSDW